MSGATSGRTLITGGTLIDGVGGEPVPNSGVVIEGNRITDVGVSSEDVERLSSNVEKTVNADGQYIMPGLIDGHCHLSLHQGDLETVKEPTSPEFAALWAARSVSDVLRAGVTGISVPGGKYFVDVTIRETVDAGLLEGPRIFCGGRALSPVGGIFDHEPTWEEQNSADAVGIICNSKDDFVREVRKQAKRGVNLIKIADDYWGDVQGISQEELDAAVDEAHRHGLKVAIHSRGASSTRASARAGVDWIFHADLATEQDLEVVAAEGIPIMPAFTAVYLAYDQGGPQRLQDQLQKNIKAIRIARDMGIEILSGTDSGNAAAYGHGIYHGYEPEILVREIGLTPMEAIQSTTSRNAKTIGLDGEVGTIEAGKLADITIWSEDPSTDISVLRRPHEALEMVMKDGAIIDGSKGQRFIDLEKEPQRARR